MKRIERTAWTEPLPVLALAFAGDAVWEVYVRDHVLASGIRKPGQLHAACTRYVRARSQARLADLLTSELTPDELGMLKRGRNAKSGHTRKSADILEYRHSTGFEALLGHLYGSGQFERLSELCERALSLIDAGEVESTHGEHS